MARSNYGSGLSGTVTDYLQIRTVPGVLMVAFFIATAYTFGGITGITFAWFDYTITGETAAIVSLLTYAVAFASSETKQFQHYEPAEQVAIAVGPLLLLGWEYTTQVPDLLLSMGDPLGAQVAFVVALGSYFTTIQ